MRRVNHTGPWVLARRSDLGSHSHLLIVLNYLILKAFKSTGFEVIKGWAQLFALDFPRGPLVKTTPFQCRGHGFDLWPGN